MSGEVPAGASRPNQELASKPLSAGPPACSTVGTSGMRAERWALVTARALSLPALMCGMDEGRLSNITSMSPPTSPAGPGPSRCRGSGHEVPVMLLNSSPARWMEVPLPLEAMFSLPGLALAYWHEVGHVLDAARGGLFGVDHHHIGHARHQRDGRKVLLRVVGHARVQRLVDAMGAHRAHQQGVAVVGRLGDQVGTDVAARARAVFHHELLAECPGQLGRDGARQDVGGATRVRRAPRCAPAWWARRSGPGWGLLSN
jgi:hypothetical protein